MAIRRIYETPDPVLRQISKPVERFDEELKTLVADMFETMYDAPGIGLAAVQVGVPIRLLVIDLQEPADPEDPESKPVRDPKTFINPEIMWHSETEVPYTEGCLSVPDEYEDVTRFGHIVVEYTDRDGKRKQKEAVNTLLSVCVQHEMDHLQGKLFVDHLSALKRELIKRRMKKLKAQREAERKGEATAL